MISVAKPGSPTEILDDLYPSNDFRRKPGSPEDVMEHVGVKGMKWGVRKAEDVAGGIGGGVKTLKTKNQARKESNAKEHVAKAANVQKQINEIKAHPSGNVFVQAHRENRIKELKGIQAQNLKDAKDIREGRLTDHQKKVIIGTAVAGTVIASYGAYKVVDSGMLNQFQTKDIPWKKNDALSRTMSADRIMKDVVEPVNPGISGEHGISAYTRSMMNCRRCTTAYEMRRRGNDVQATRTMTATGQTVAGMMRATDPNSHINTSAVSVMAKMASHRGEVAEAMKANHGLGEKIHFTHDVSTVRADAIFEAIGKHPNGARGELGVTWRNVPAAHSMAWEVIGGKPHIFDTQLRKHFPNPKSFLDVSDNIQHAGLTRLDNKDLNEDFLRRWMKNV